MVTLAPPGTGIGLSVRPWWQLAQRFPVSPKSTEPWLGFQMRSVGPLTVKA
jgi:hypothetical protein